ncbi:MAG: radical SAM protein [Solobacterium sp.]|nr:radical SAM protein [Solobacterium sp.]
MNQKVLLITPAMPQSKYSIFRQSETECTDAEVWMAVLKQYGYSVSYYDGQFSTETIEEELQQKDPAFVVVFGKLCQETAMLECCVKAKKQDPSIVTVIAGEHAQLAYRRMYQDGVDYILNGYDPVSLIYVLGGSTGRWQPNGICHKVDGVWQQIPAKPYDIRKLPHADRTVFDANRDRYRFLGLAHTASVRTAFGCPHRCTFCSVPYLNKGIVSRRDIVDIVQEIVSLQTDNIYITDDDFMTDEERVREFLAAVKEAGLHKQYICHGRPDFIASHAELIREMKEAGFAYILSGLEYISDSMLAAYGKGFTAGVNEECIRVCKDAGIRLAASFIVGPDYRAMDFRDLLRYITDHDLKYADISILTPEPGTPLYEQYKERRMTEDASQYDRCHLTVRPMHMPAPVWEMLYSMLSRRLAQRAKKSGIIV